MHREDRGAFAALVAAVVFGLVLRVVVAGDVAFSPADEGRYLAMASAVSARGIGAFHDLVVGTLASPEMQLFPSPLRYAHVMLAGLACRLHGGASYEALAALSTAAGVASVALTGWIGLRVAGARSGAVAAFVIACAPLALALGRRALQDSVVVAAAALLLALAIELRREETFASVRARWLALAGAFAAAFLVASKETSVFLLVPFVIDAGVAAAKDRREAWRVVPFVAGPLLAVAGFLAFVGTYDELAALLAVAQRSADGAYVRAYMAGPPQRVLVDLLALAPVASLLAFVGLMAPRAASRPWPGARLVDAYVIAGLVAAACLPKNLRFTAALEPALAVLAARGLASLEEQAAGALRRTLLTTGALVALGLSSWLIFVRAFLERRVYDPTTFDLLVALDAVPHGGAMSPGTLAAPATLLLVGAASLAISLGVRAPASRRES